VPSAQGEHSRSAFEVPLALTWLPFAHVLQGVQLEAFSVALNQPLAQAAQVRSEALEGTLVTYVPLGQADHATHPVAVAPSWSQVPSAHGPLSAASCGSEPDVTRLQPKRTLAQKSVTTNDHVVLEAAVDRAPFVIESASGRKPFSSWRGAGAVTGLATGASSWRGVRILEGRWLPSRRRFAREPGA